MSHFSKIKAQITDQEALQAATANLGFSLIPNGKCRYYYGTESADLVIKLPGRYDVALTEQHGSYAMKADLFDGEVEKYLGPGANILMQQYATEKVRIEAYKHSLAVAELHEADDIILTLTDTDTGGQINIICHLGGKIDLKTTGFPGQSCMKFKDLEDALGISTGFEPTMEFYEADPSHETEVISTFLE